MDSFILFRTGNVDDLAAEFIRFKKDKSARYVITKLENPAVLMYDDVLAVHYADPGAQGDAGAVEILYRSKKGVQYLYGNFAYGDLDLDAVIQKLPFLRSLDTRYGEFLPYPYGGKLTVPEDWGYMYMGAMNHLFVRKTIAEPSEAFVSLAVRNMGTWNAFDALAWFCGIPISA